MYFNDVAFWYIGKVSSHLLVQKKFVFDFQQFEFGEWKMRLRSDSNRCENGWRPNCITTLPRSLFKYKITI